MQQVQGSLFSCSYTLIGNLLCTTQPIMLCNVIDTIRQKSSAVMKAINMGEPN